VFPTYRGTQWPRWKVSLGAKLYDLLCGMRNFGYSSVLSPKQTSALLPGIAAEGITGSVRYFDALTNDARLVLDTLRSAENHGAKTFNYLRLDGAQNQNGIWHCELRDVLSSETQTVCARTVVNATGPWSDRLPNSSTTLRLTKGVHLVIDRARLPIPDAVVMTEGDRILFAIPWGERVILGTTDTDYDGPLQHPTCDEADTGYVLDVANSAFPESSLTTCDVISQWAGLRPLVADPHGNPSDISRRHEVLMSQPGWWDVTGGKLTTYRLMAEETVDAIVKFTNATVPRCRTASEPLLSEAADRLASGILPPEVSPEVVQHCCTREWVRRLDDLMIRRTSWRYYLTDHLEVAAQVADWMSRPLGWSDLMRSAEIGRYRQIVGADPGVPSPHHENNGSAWKRAEVNSHSENGARWTAAANRTNLSNS
jgi:glycerol-3-phosphate dehydrogenase